VGGRELVVELGTDRWDFVVVGVHGGEEGGLGISIEAGEGHEGAFEAMEEFYGWGLLIKELSGSVEKFTHGMGWAAGFGYGFAECVEVFHGV
jgi:hypothetical protein